MAGLEATREEPQADREHQHGGRDQGPTWGFRCRSEAPRFEGAGKGLDYGAQKGVGGCRREWSGSRGMQVWPGLMGPPLA